MGLRPAKFLKNSMRLVGQALPPAKWNMSFSGQAKGPTPPKAASFLRRSARSPLLLPLGSEDIELVAFLGVTVRAEDQCFSIRRKFRE